LVIRQVADQTWEGAIRLAKLWEANPRSRKAGVSEPDPAPLAPRESGQSSRCDEACHPRGSNERQQPWGFPPAGADPWSLGSALSRRDLREFTAHSSRLVERHAAGEFTLDKALPQESPDRESRSQTLECDSPRPPEPSPSPARTILLTCSCVKVFCCAQPDRAKTNAVPSMRNVSALRNLIATLRRRRGLREIFGQILPRTKGMVAVEWV